MLKSDDKKKQFTRLESLSSVSRKTARVLRESHIPCVEFVAYLTAADVQVVTELTEELCKKIVEESRSYLGLNEFRSAIEHEDEWSHRRRLSTGIEELDVKLLGGIESGSVVEFVGPSACGKTQWCLQLAVTSQFSRGHVLWLDSESDFSPVRIRCIAIRMGLDPDETLHAISVARVVNIEHLEQMMVNLPTMVVEKNISLIVIDSLGGLLQLEYRGFHEAEVLQKTALRLFERLHVIAESLDCIVVYTNQVFENNRTYGNLPNAPMGGHLFSNSNTLRLYMGKAFNERRRLRLHSHPYVGKMEMELELGHGGFYLGKSKKIKMEPALSEYIAKHHLATSTVPWVEVEECE